MILNAPGHSFNRKFTIKKNYLVLQRQQNIDPWCNWQHVGFWFRRVLVRAQVGQQKSRKSGFSAGMG
jgi:hypothetical protein